MLKSFHLTVAISSIFTLLPGIALSNPLSVSSSLPVVVNSNSDSFVCYMRTTDGKTINLDSLCKKDQPDSNKNSITKANSNSGSGQCYFLDANGRPCTSSK